MRRTEFKLLDSSIWLAYFFAEREEVKELIESETILYTSSLSIFEVKRKLKKEGMEGVKEAMDFIKERSIIVEVTEEIADSAADISTKYGLHAMDALIYACAMSVNSELATADPHFEGVEGVWLMK